MLDGPITVMPLIRGELRKVDGVICRARPSLIIVIGLKSRGRAGRVLKAGRAYRENVMFSRTLKTGVGCRTMAEMNVYRRVAKLSSKDVRLSRFCFC